MSTSNFADYTSLVTTGNKPSEYVTQGTYTGAVTTVPKSSLLKLSVAPGNEKYFSAAPAFEQRLDNFRIPAPSKTPVVLDNTDMNTNMTMSMGGGSAGSGDYYALGAGAYKLNPM
jgi:hypothetical protein